MSDALSFFASCPRYLEDMLALELRALGAQDSKSTVGGVNFTADLKQAYTVCLWSRLANRILLQLSETEVDTRDEVYAAAAAVDWRDHIGVSKAGTTASISVDFSGSSDNIRNTHFGSQLIKDAVVDQFSSEDRPAVDKQTPGVRLNAHLAKGRLTLAIDISGDSLHRRGYRVSGGQAPLKENLAAAILVRTGWPERDFTNTTERTNALYDPMCGSGTLLIEAAMMALDIAPGLLRQRWGFKGWRHHDASGWQEVLDDAKQRHTAGIAASTNMQLFGSDIDPRIISVAKKSLERLGLQDHCQLSCSALNELENPLMDSAVAVEGLLLSNPPYGERLGDEESLEPVYVLLGKRIKENFPEWQVAIYGANVELLEALRLRPDKKYRLRNGALEGQLRLYSIAEDLKLKDDDEPGSSVAVHKGPVVAELVNRLKKNQKRLRRALKPIDTNCYRLYDADLPEYASAVDIYDDHAVVSEYAAPDTIDPKKAKRRLQATLASVQHVLELPTEQVIYKRKQRQKGNEQYQKNSRGSDYVEVFEGAAKLLVNLHDYHDTGLFLDHRPVRRLIAERARGKRFLNLFCYTAAATVHAVHGGAKSSVSVDMSAPYITWAQNNLRLNKANATDHVLEQADCLKWLWEQAQFARSADFKPYDMILLDPPSFSNSKRMEEVLDIQRDHAQLIDACLLLLADKGQIIFSTNRKKFQLDKEIQVRAKVEDVTQATLDPDFQRPAPAHKCWIIEKLPTELSS